MIKPLADFFKLDRGIILLINKNLNNALFRALLCLILSSPLSTIGAEANRASLALINRNASAKIIFRQSDSEIDELIASESAGFDMSDLEQAAQNLIHKRAQSLSDDTPLGGRPKRPPQEIFDRAEEIFILTLPANPLEAFSLDTITAQDVSALGLTFDFVDEDGALSYTITNKQMSIFWPKSAFHHTAPDNYISDVKGYLWQEFEGRFEGGLAEAITGQLRLSFADKDAQLRLLSDQSVYVLQFALDNIDDIGLTFATGELNTARGRQKTDNYLGLMGDGGLAASLLFKTHKIDDQSVTAGIVSTLTK